jgi:hypothetical protein
MDENKKSLNLNDIIEQLKQVLGIIKKYIIIIFIVLVVGVYGYIINGFDSAFNQAPNASEVQSSSNSFVLIHINQQVINQINSLRNNSVNVQALFQQSRNNPF